MIKVAVVGFGLSASIFHLPFIKDSSQFSLVAISTSQAEIIAKKYPQITVYDSASQMIESSGADLVVISSPNQSHYALAQQALNAGLHVLLEKPMTSTSEQALTLAKLASKKSLVLSIFHNRRWDGDFLTLERILRQGDLGDIKTFSSHFDRFRPQVTNRWRDQAGVDTGIWYDLGSHLLDQVLYLFGAPLALTANCAKLRDDAKSDDYFQVMLHYQNMEIVLQSSPFCASPNIRFQLQGSKGSYVKYGLDPQEGQLKEGIEPQALAFGVEPPANYGVKYLADPLSAELKTIKVETLKGCYQEYYVQLAQAINLGSKPPVDAIEGAKVMKLIELAIQSSELGQRLNVDLSDFSEDILVR